MAPTFFLIPGGVFFALLCIPCFVILVIGILVRSKALKWVGGMTLLINAGFVGAAVVGYFYIAAMESLVLLTGPYTRSEPNPEDLVGTYRPTSRSVRFIKRKGYDPIPNSCIILHADGTFEMRNIPDMWLNKFGEEKGKFDSAAGTWELDYREYGRIKHWGIGLHFTDVTAITSRTSDRGFYHSMLSLKNQKPPYIIYLIIGDPDSGEALQFERIATESKAR